MADAPGDDDECPDCAKGSVFGFEVSNAHGDHLVIISLLRDLNLLLPRVGIFFNVYEPLHLYLGISLKFLGSTQGIIKPS